MVASTLLLGLFPPSLEHNG